jgi:predicted ester cyclase
MTGRRYLFMHTTSEENKVIVRRFGEAMNTRQYHLLDEIVAPDLLRHCQATPEVDVRSLQQFKAFLKQDLAVFPDSVQTLKHLIAEGDMVAVWIGYEGTQRGQMGPFPPSGKKMRVDCAAIVRVENGKIAELWVTWDNMAALAQLGHLPSPPGKSG